jgi:uncharacterized Tic20 family protein
MAEHDKDTEVTPNGDEERLSRLSGGAAPTPETIVEEYEARYNPEPRKRKSMPRSYSTLRVKDDDKLWAAVAHGSVWVTFLMAVPTSGISIPFVVFIPLIIYALFRKRSDYIAFHALQAFVLQLVCTVGALTAFIIGGAVWLLGLVLAALLMLVLVGFIILPLWVLVGMIASFLVSLVPLAGLVLATIAVVRIYTGGDYRYPYVSDWVDRQMAGGLLNV